MTVWRLARSVYPALDGEGARRWGGRWDEPGTPVVYASEHLSLAVLESLVHTDPDLLPDDLTAFRIQAPDEIAAPALAAYETGLLPADWREPEVSAQWGEARAASGGPILFVPSAVVPLERNVLINPRRAQAAGIDVVRREPFSFDARLVGG